MMRTFDLAKIHSKRATVQIVIVDKAFSTWKTVNSFNMLVTLSFFDHAFSESYDNSLKRKNVFAQNFGAFVYCRSRESN